MVCVSITITHRNWGDPRNAVIGYYSSSLDGNYAQGDNAWGWGGYGTPTDAEYLENTAIPKTISYLNATFKSLYGRDMKRTDVCGQEGWTPPCTPVWVCESPLNGYEADGCGNRRANPACNPPQGNISFVSTPPGAGIFIDGTDQGVKTPTTAMNVTAGDHTYVLKLAGYNDYSGTVSVVTGQTATVSAALIPTCVPAWKCEIPLKGYETDGCGNRRANPACNPPQIGNISFVSTPPGAGIFIDGAEQGINTPATITNLSSGDHTYKLVLSGYKDATGTFTIEPGMTTTVSVPLTKAEAGVGAGMILGISLLGLGVIGAVVVATREKKPEYTLPKYKGG